MDRGGHGDRCLAYFIQLLDLAAFYAVFACVFLMAKSTAFADSSQLIRLIRQFIEKRKRKITQVKLILSIAKIICVRRTVHWFSDRIFSKC